MIKEYSMMFDLVNEQEDWDDDKKIRVESMVIYSTDEDDAYDRCAKRIEDEYPGMLYYIWDITDDDVSKLE